MLTHSVHEVRPCKPFEREVTTRVVDDGKCMTAETSPTELEKLCAIADALGSDPSMIDCLVQIKADMAEVIACLEVLKSEPEKPQYVQTSNEETGTCIPLLAEIACDADGNLIEPFPLGYINENGEFTVATEFTLKAPGATTEVCAMAQVTMLEIIGDGTDQTVDAMVAAAIAAEAPMFEFPGKAPVAVAAGDIDDVMIIAKPCGTTDSADAEVLLDTFDVNGNGGMSKYHDDAQGGVDGDAIINIPVGGCVLVSMCFKSCLDKAALAELADAE